MFLKCLIILDVCSIVGAGKLFSIILVFLNSDFAKVEYLDVYNHFQLMKLFDFFPYFLSFCIVDHNSVVTNSVFGIVQIFLICF